MGLAFDEEWNYNSIIDWKRYREQYRACFIKEVETNYSGGCVL